MTCHEMFFVKVKMLVTYQHFILRILVEIRNSGPKLIIFLAKSKFMPITTTKLWKQLAASYIKLWKQFNSRVADMEEIATRMQTQIKLIIEAEIKRGTEWKTAIPEPYLTLWYDVAICIDDCPLPLPWSSWSCHCQLGSDYNTRSGDDSNPDDLPDCPCAKTARYRIQMCKDNNKDAECRNDPNPSDTCLSLGCHII